MGKLSFNANEVTDKKLLKEAFYKECEEYWKTLEESNDDNSINNAIENVAELKKKQKKINDSKYVPSPYDSTIKENSKTKKVDNVSLTFNNDTISSPFVQCNPITVHTILKASREISGFGRARHDKSSVVGEGGLNKKCICILLVLLKKDSNFIKLDKERVMQIYRSLEQIDMQNI